MNEATAKDQLVGVENQFGNFGNQLITEILPERDFERYA
jgi:hypothetical protein